MKYDYIKDTRIRRTYSVRKRKSTDYVLKTGSPYRDAEGSPQLISCLHDAIVNAATRTKEKWTNQNYIDNVRLEG